MLGLFKKTLCVHKFYKKSDVIISDLPVGFYPNDDIAKRYKSGKFLMSIPMPTIC